MENNDIYVRKLSKPISYEENEYTELTFDFGSLSGNDMLKVDRDMKEFAPIPAFSLEFSARLAARAAKVDFDVMELLSVSDFNAVTQAARNFINRKA